MTTEMSKGEEVGLAKLALDLEAINGRSGAYTTLLESIDRMIADASRIPAEYFEPTERAGYGTDKLLRDINSRLRNINSRLRRA